MSSTAGSKIGLPTSASSTPSQEVGKRIGSKRATTVVPAQETFPLRRAVGIVFGAGTQIYFAYTVYYLFFFLFRGIPATGKFVPMVDVLLSLLFVVPHSLLLWPKCSSYLKRWISAPFYGCFFCCVTCFTLLVLFRYWSSSSTVIWQLEGWGRYVVQGAFFASWIGLFYSISLTGLGYQTGLTPWLYWLRKQPSPKRLFVPRGAYHLLRHPIYLSFLGLIWFTPTMSLDHAILTGIWTVYIFVGSYFKDCRLEHFLGESYRDYETKVAGYPGIPFGPLAKRRRPTPTK